MIINWKIQEHQCPYEQWSKFKFNIVDCAAVHFDKLHVLWRKILQSDKLKILFSHSNNKTVCKSKGKVFKPQNIVIPH